MNDKQELLKAWQQRLGLQDWRIVLETDCKPEDMALEECAGCTVWTECNKTARIEIIDPDYYGERIVPFDFEKTLIHELLHLKTSLISDNVSELQQRYTHQLIDDLARAFAEIKKTTAPLVGKWKYYDCVNNGDGLISGYACSVCDSFVDEEMFNADEFHKDFCGNCGAIMKGDEECGHEGQGRR